VTVDRVAATGIGVVAAIDATEDRHVEDAVDMDSLVNDCAVSVIDRSVVAVVTQLAGTIIGVVNVLGVSTGAHGPASSSSVVIVTTGAIGRQVGHTPLQSGTVIVWCPLGSRTIIMTIVSSTSTVGIVEAAVGACREQSCVIGTCAKEADFSGLYTDCDCATGMVGGIMAVTTLEEILGRGAVVVGINNGGYRSTVIVDTMRIGQCTAGVVTGITGERTRCTPSRAGASAVAVGGRTGFCCTLSEGTTLLQHHINSLIDVLGRIEAVERGTVDRRVIVAFLTLYVAIANVGVVAVGVDRPVVAIGIIGIRLAQNNSVTVTAGATQIIGSKIWIVVLQVADVAVAVTLDIVTGGAVNGDLDVLVEVDMQSVAGDGGAVTDRIVMALFTTKIFTQGCGGTKDVLFVSTGERCTALGFVVAAGTIEAGVPGRQGQRIAHLAVAVAGQVEAVAVSIARSQCGAIVACAAAAIGRVDVDVDFVIGVHCGTVAGIVMTGRTCETTTVLIEISMDQVRGCILLNTNRIALVTGTAWRGTTPCGCAVSQGGARRHGLNVGVAVDRGAAGVVGVITDVSLGTGA